MSNSIKNIDIKFQVTEEQNSKVQKALSKKGAKWDEAGTLSPPSHLLNTYFLRLRDGVLSRIDGDYPASFEALTGNLLHWHEAMNVINGDDTVETKELTAEDAIRQLEEIHGCTIKLTK